MSKFTFNRKTKFTGRNGYFDCSGIDLEVLNHNQSVMIAPLTGRTGTIARCDIEVPLEDLPELIQQLQEISSHIKGDCNEEKS